MISVIMITYNRKQFLPRILGSISKQDYRDYELVIVVNGSTDGSIEFCRERACEDSKIRVIEIPRRSIALARETGLKAARGEFITYVDDDDYAEHDMLSFLYENLTRADADISMCGSYSDINGELAPYFIYDETYVYNKAEALRELLKREKFNVAPPTKLFRKELFDGVDFPENARYDDIHFIYKVIANANRVVVNGSPKYYFYKHEQNNSGFILTNGLTPEQLDEYLEAISNRTVYLSKRVPEIAEQARYSELSYMISMCNKIQENDLMSVCSCQYEFMKGILRANEEQILNCRFVTDTEKKIMYQYIV